MSAKNLFSNWSRYRADKEHGGYQHYEHMWAMSFDLNKCIGCNACAVACYAENNLPVVGEARFDRSQPMHWMRIERYWDEADLAKEAPESVADLEDFQVRGASFLPMNCQQCNAAPCEPVCPVLATYHTPDGLNAQVYNRCIGSRYCSNNCPYRLRYFNWYYYYDYSWPHPLELQLNPDLSVRGMGVMEKCTFCVQRIRNAKDKAEMEHRPVQDGEFQTACQQTCPTSAIVFGDMLNPNSQVAQLWHRHQVELGRAYQDKEDPKLRGYRVLEALNTDPCVLMLDRVREV